MGGGWSAYSSHLGRRPSRAPLGPTLTVSPLASSSPLCSGWIAALSTLKQDHLPVSIIMMVVAGFFTLCAVLSLFLLKRVSGGRWANRSLSKQAPLPCLRLGAAHHWRQLGPPGRRGPVTVPRVRVGGQAGPQGALLSPASFRRCTPCTAGRGPASSRPRRSFPRGSSATGPSAAPPPLPPEEPSRGTSPPASPSSAPAFSLACLLAALAVVP